MLGIRLAGCLRATSGVSGQSWGVNTHLLQLCMKRIYSNQPLAAEADPLTHIYSNGCRGAVSRHANGGCVWQRSAPRGQRGPVCVKVCVSSVSLSRPPSQVINVNAFSLRLTQMGADVCTHIHAHWSSLNKAVLSRQQRVGGTRESEAVKKTKNESVCIQWSSAGPEKHVQTLWPNQPPLLYRPPVRHETPVLAGTRCPQQNLRMRFKDMLRSASKTALKTQAFRLKRRYRSQRPSAVATQVSQDVTKWFSEWKDVLGITGGLIAPAPALTTEAHHVTEKANQKTKQRPVRFRKVSGMFVKEVEV